MEIKNKENKYMVLIVLISTCIGLLIGFPLGRFSYQPIGVVENPMYSEKPSTQQTQTVNVNTSAKEETEEHKININTATEKELESLPGIGESIANNIITYRSEHGLFANISELMNVDRIGSSTYQNIKDKVVVE